VGYHAEALRHVLGRISRWVRSARQTTNYCSIDTPAEDDWAGKGVDTGSHAKRRGAHHGGDCVRSSFSAFVFLRELTYGPRRACQACVLPGQEK
jgi:hypothetical protein